MALYTRESKERVRDAVDFVALVSARTDLRAAGTNSYVGLCPFHDERSPSFGINSVEKLYYCFGCEASGDLFTFVQETEGLDFKGALEQLADRSGVALELEDEDPREAQKRARRERLLSLLTRTAGYYERTLWEAAEAAPARAYLAQRGLSEAILREFRVGYAPSQWNKVLLASRRSGFSEQELYTVGLVQRAQGGRVYDRFRERIMFPLADVRGRVLGFGARAMRADQGPKYLNTSDNDVYHKGSYLYGADLARPHATRAGRTIVCEGYTDVIALHQAGLRETVGLMGTAMTEEQVSELGRLATKVLLALDADSAGQEAMLRASRAAARRRLELRVVGLPAGTDPAELVARDGPEALGQAVAASVPFVRFRVERVLAGGDYGSPEGRDRTLNELRPLFGDALTLPPGAMRDELLRIVSSRFNLRENVTETLLAAPVQAPALAAAGVGVAAGGAGGGRGVAAGPGGGGTRVPGVGAGRGGDRAAGAQRAPEPAEDSRGPRRIVAPLDRREQTERTFLALCVAVPDQGADALAGVDLDEHFTSDVVRRAARHLREHLRSPGEALPPDDPALAAVIAELSVRAGRELPRPAVLELERLQLELARVDRQIQAARTRERGDVSELAARRNDIKAAVDKAYERVLEQAEA